MGDHPDRRDEPEQPGLAARQCAELLGGSQLHLPVGQTRSPATARGSGGHAAGFTARAAAKHQALDLATVLGQLATNQLRLEGMRGLATEERATLGLARTRLAAGFSTPLDVDRMEIELFRVEQQGVAAEAEMAGILARCTAVVRTRCTAFPNSSDARTFLTSWVSRTLAQDGPPEQRAELRALDASRVAAEADIDLAKAQAIPDPTVRLGYMHDRFVASGNQQNSVNLSVSLPLTFFDHGQALRRAAEARVSRLDAVRTALVRTAPARVGALRDALVAQQQRQSAIDTQILPRARSVVTDLQRAADNRLIPLIDVINARRTLSELLIQQADSYDDAFNVSIDLLAELPEPETSKKEPHP